MREDSTYPGRGPRLYQRLHYTNCVQFLTIFLAGDLRDLNCANAMFLVYNTPGSPYNVLAMHCVSNCFAFKLPRCLITSKGDASGMLAPYTCVLNWYLPYHVQVPTVLKKTPSYLSKPFSRKESPHLRAGSCLARPDPRREFYWCSEEMSLELHKMYCHIVFI